MSKKPISPDIEALLRIGTQMANILYNLKQDPKADKRYTSPAADLQPEWDRLRNVYERWHSDNG